MAESQVLYFISGILTSGGSYIVMNTNIKMFDFPCDLPVDSKCPDILINTSTYIFYPLYHEFHDFDYQSTVPSFVRLCDVTIRGFNSPNEIL